MLINQELRTKADVGSIKEFLQRIEEAEAKVLDVLKDLTEDVAEEAAA
jgi:hypothetical protein